VHVTIFIEITIAGSCIHTEIHTHTHTHSEIYVESYVSIQTSPATRHTSLHSLEVRWHTQRCPLPFVASASNEAQKHKDGSAWQFQR